MIGIDIYFIINHLFLENPTETLPFLAISSKLKFVGLFKS